MQQITVNKDELIAIVKKNRVEHQKLYEEAVLGYHVEVCDKLEDALREASCGEKYTTNLNMSKPEHHIKDYDKIIGMLELSNESDIILLPHEYDQYVADEWHWAGMTNTINAMYASKIK